MASERGRSGAPWWQPRRPPLLVAPSTAWTLLVAGVAGFAGAAIVVGAGATGWDAALYRNMNEVPGVLAAVLTPFSRLFLFGGLTAAAAIAVVYVVVRNRSVLPVLVGVAAALVAMLSADLAKLVASRPRPYEVIADAVLRQQPAHGTSFPSSHTAVALATAIALVPFLSRPAAGVAIVYAALVGWSRVYVGVHYPLDVLAGAGIGVAIGGAALLLTGRLLRDVQPAGRSAGGPAP